MARYDRKTGIFQPEKPSIGHMADFCATYTNVKRKNGSIQNRFK